MGRPPELGALGVARSGRGQALAREPALVAAAASRVGKMNFAHPTGFVSTVGRDEKTIREYIQRQEEEDRRLDQGKMFD